MGICRLELSFHFQFVTNFTEHRKGSICLCTPANPLIPGRFVTSFCTCPSGICDELCSLFGYSLCLHSLLEINHAASLKLPDSMSGWVDPWEFMRMVFLAESKIGFFMLIFMSQGYQGCDCHVGVTRTAATLSSWIFLKTFPISENGGKA